MDQTTKSFGRFIGCDVGKKELVSFDSQTQTITKTANQPGKLARFMAGLDQTCLIVCEATGGYETALLEAAVQAGIAAPRADARKVKAFIRSFGTLGKTDAIDARALASYGAERQARLGLWRQPNEQRQTLHGLVLARIDILKDRVAYNNRLLAPGAAAAKHHFKSILALLQRRIQAIEGEIKILLETNPELGRDIETMRTIPGIGPGIATTLLALVPEIGTLNRREIAALAGLAPHPRQSGAKDNYRSTRGGRPQVKQALFMAGLAAAKKTSPFHCFYQKLIANGKKPIVAVVAIMRKIIVIANAKLRDQHKLRLS